METLTLAVALVAAVIIIASRPAYGLVAFLALLLLYPDYLRVSLGTIDISACRIAVIILLVRCFADPAITNSFQWKPIDTLVLLSMAVYAVALAFTTPFDIWLENRAGFIMDSFFAYLAVRLVIVDRNSFVLVAKAVALMTAFLAVHAVAETFAGVSIYKGLGQYCPWAPTKGMEYQVRHGLNRAMGPSGETIMFGLTFAICIPMIWMLRQEAPPWRRWAYPLTFLGIVGVAATVSSGPYLALIVVLGCLVLERVKFLVAPALVILVFGCAAVELISNRHFYNVLGDLTMDPASAYYRARLIEVALQKLHEYWVVGYGLVDPGWGPEIIGLKKTDMVNDYVLQAALHGLGGLVAYVLIQVVVLHIAYTTHKHSPSPWVRSCAWAMASSLICLMFASFSVSVFGQMTTVYYCLLAFMAALPVLARGQDIEAVKAHGNARGRLGFAH